MSTFQSKESNTKPAQSVCFAAGSQICAMEENKQFISLSKAIHPTRIIMVEYLQDLFFHNSKYIACHLKHLARVLSMTLCTYLFMVLTNCVCVVCTQKVTHYIIPHSSLVVHGSFM